MQIESSATGDLLVLTVQGVLDNESSVHFLGEIETFKRQGWHRIVADLSGVTYVSSAGVSALLSAKRQLQELSGLFGIFNPTEQVTSVLEQVRLLDALRCDPRTAQQARSTGTLTMALSASTRLASGEGLDMEIYSLRKARPLTCRVVGQPTRALQSAAPPTHCVTFDSQSYGIGLGRLGDDADRRQTPAGEIISIAGAVAQSPHTNGGLPDYLVAAESFTPVAQLLYGVQWSGEFSTLIRFEPTQRGTKTGLSSLVRQAMRQTECAAAAFVVLADCAGLVGAQMRRLPEASTGSQSNHFQVPQIRDWLSFSAERIHRHNLALIVGVATMGESQETSPLRPFIRQCDPGGQCFGHFHSAVFPYKPLKKRTLQLGSEVAELFDNGALEDVLHLVHDDRPYNGAGESELLNGACWISSIDAVDQSEELA